MSKKFVRMLKTHHDFKKFVMTSKTRHDVKNTLWCQKNRHDVNNTSWCQKVCHDAKQFVMTSKTRHDKKFVLTSFKTYHDVKQLVMTSHKFVMMSKTHHGAKTFLMVSKSSSWHYKYFDTNFTFLRCVVSELSTIMFFFHNFDYFELFPWYVSANVGQLLQNLYGGGRVWHMHCPEISRGIGQWSR